MLWFKSFFTVCFWDFLRWWVFRIHNCKVFLNTGASWPGVHKPWDHGNKVPRQVFQSNILQAVFLNSSLWNVIVVSFQTNVCKNLLFDTCILTCSGNRLLYPSCTKLICRQVFREFLPLPGRFEHYARLLMTVVHMHRSWAKNTFFIEG